MTDLRAAITFLCTFTFITSPLLTAPFTGFREEQLPFPQIDPPVQPEGYAFAIWGLIYAWLLISALFGIAVRTQDEGWEHTRPPLILALILGTPWLWVANQDAIAATALIFAMAICAIWALMRSPSHERMLLRTPVAIFAGWLTAASFVSLASTAAGYRIVMDQIGWAYAGIIGALLVTLLVQNRVKAAPEYGITVIWALAWIIVANYADYKWIAGTALVGIVLIALTITRNIARAPAA